MSGVELASADLIRGWCPTPLRPMMSGDGMITRIIPRSEGFDGLKLKLIADCAEDFGNGQIEITQRRNVQLRGLTEASHRGFLEKARAGGLIGPEVETVTLIAAPSRRFDPTAKADSVALAAAMAAQPEMRAPGAYPAKFMTVIGSGGAMGCDELQADLRVDPLDGGWRVALCGNRATALPVFLGTAAGVLQAVAGLLRAYPSGAQRRGRGADFATGWAAAAGLQALTAPIAASADDSGITVLRPAFGRLTAGELRSLASAAMDASVALLPTRGRALLPSRQSPSHLAHLMALARHFGFITEADDARRFMDVCSGAPLCPNAGKATFADANALARLLGGALSEDRRLHISGCVKGCARPSRAAFALAAVDGVWRMGRNATAEEAAKGLPYDRLAAIAADIRDGRSA